MKCKHCGTEISNDSMYCEFCGTKIEVITMEGNGQHSNKSRFQIISESKRKAKDDLEGHRMKFIPVTLIYITCFGINILIDANISGDIDDSISHWFVSDCISGGIDLMSSLIPIGYCFSLVFLNFIRGGKKHMVKLMFSHFKNYKRAVGTTFMVTLYTLLWSLLLIVPGIIKSFAYSMTYYISMDHPEYTVDECIEASRLMMDGHKWELFVLYLSFIGWILLGIITLGIGFLWIIPYFATTIAHYYEHIKQGYENTQAI